MQDYADYKVMTQEDRRKLFSLLQVLKREFDGSKAPAQVCALCCALPAWSCCERNDLMHALERVYAQCVT